MKGFSAFVKKEFLHILRDVRALWIILAMPVILVLLFGFALSNDIKKANIAVLDSSGDVLAARITERINASEYFRVFKILASPAEADAVLKSGAAKAVVTFPSDFMRDIPSGAKINIACDACDPNEASSISAYIRALAFDQLRAEFGAARLESDANAEPGIRFLYNPQLKSSFYFVPGVMGLILFLVCALLTSVGILRERESGSMEILLTSPVRPLAIIAAKALPYVLISVVVITEIFLIVKFVVDVPIVGSVPLLYGVSLIFIALSLSLGILISTIANNSQTAMFLVLALLILPTIILSGMVFPIENMPLPLRIISNVVPATWYNIAVKDVMLKGLGFSDVLKPVGVLCAMTAAFTLISLARFKTKL